MLRGSNTGIVRQMAARSEPIAYDGSEIAFTDYAYSELGEKEVILATDAFLPADEHFADPARCPLCYWPEPISTTAAGMVVTKGFGDAWMISRYIRVFQVSWRCSCGWNQRAIHDFLGVPRHKWSLMVDRHVCTVFSS